MGKSYDFVAIGDIVIDAFIRLKEASVNCDVNREQCRLSMAFGDKVPYEFVEIVKAVGNSPNAAVSASRLGLSSALISNLGNDQNGKDCLESLKRDSVSTEYVQIHNDMQTNYHYVLWYEDERTILVKHQEYNYKFPNIDEPKWLYLSSLAENSLPYHEEINIYLENHPNTKLAFQPGTFQMKLGVEKLAKLYKKTEVFFCNVEEAKRILNINQEITIKDLLKKMADLGPKIIVITDGPRGAYAHNGEETWFIKPYPDSKPPYDRTGAGDAFASTFTSSLALGLSIPDALTWAPINSMSVVQCIGAQKGLLDRRSLEIYLKEAPENYKPEILN